MGSITLKVISKTIVRSLFLVSLPALFFISGCVVQATPGQVSAARERNVLLGQGFSSAVYPVSLEQAINAVAPVGRTQNAVCVKEYILVAKGPKQSSQWIEKQPGMQLSPDCCRAATAYTGRWQLGDCGKCKYYDVTITPFSLNGRPGTPAVKIVIDPVLTIRCTSADYDKYISFNQAFEENLGVQPLPVQ